MGRQGRERGTEKQLPAWAALGSSPRKEEREADCEQKCCGISNSQNSLPSSALEKP